MNLLKQFLQIIKNYRGLLVLSVICSLFFSLMSMVPPLIVRKIIQWLTEGGGSLKALIGLTLVLLATYILRGVFRYGYGCFSHIAAYRVLHDLMVRVYPKLQGLSHRFFADHRTGDLISRSINDIETVEDFVAHGIPNLILAIVIPGAMIMYLFTISFQLTLLTLVPIPFIAVATYFLTQKIHTLFRGVREGLSDLVAQVQDNLTGNAIIKSFTQEKEQTLRVASRSKIFRDRMIAANKLSLIPAGGIEAGSGLGMAVVVLFGGRMALHQEISVADLFIFVAYLSFIYQPFLQIASTSDMIFKAMASLERVFEVLNLRSEITNPSSPIIPRLEKWFIQFENVTFGYHESMPVLKDITFRVGEGRMVALVGPTGAGKTTLTHLIPRFYDAQQGVVMVSGHDVKTLDLTFLRKNVATVQQDIFLFHGTIGENIRFGRPEASEKEIIAAAQKANANEFIDQLPEGYNSIIGERGIRLSGGQKQRVAIARAVLKDAPLLIFDEATSSVDAETENLIQEALSRLAVQRTTIIIAHRLSTIRNADFIVVLDQGRVVQQGRHDDLIGKGDLYTRLYDAQNLSSKWNIKDHTIT